MPGERLRVRTEEGDSRRWGSPASGLAGRYNHDPSYPQYLCILQFMGEEDVAGGGDTQTLNSVHNWGYVFRIVSAGPVGGAVKAGMLGNSGVPEGEFITGS